MSTDAHGDQLSYDELAADMVRAHNARVQAEAARKVAVEASMATRAYHQTFDPFDAAPVVEGNPSPAVTHAITRKQIKAAMKGATYR